jgi:GT2 family glycosyltransferase
MREPSRLQTTFSGKANEKRGAASPKADGVMQFVVIVNSFNRRDLLIEALGSLVNAVDPSLVDYAIVVFEAGSTDGSREWLAQFAAEHHTLKLEIVGSCGMGDSSFAAGVNRACQHALETCPEAEFLFLYETDNWLSSSEPLIAAMQLLRGEPALAAVGFTVRLHSGKPAGWGCSFPTVLSFVLGPQLSMWLGIPRTDVKLRSSDGLQWFPADVVYTSPLMIRATVWRSLGGIDAQRFPFSDSDVDWAWKVTRAEYRLAVIPTDAVVHDNLNSLSDWSSMRMLHFHLARFRLLRKYRGPGVVLAIPALFLRHLAEYSVLAALVLVGRRPALSLRKRWRLLGSVWSGYESLRGSTKGRRRPFFRVHAFNLKKNAPVSLENAAPVSRHPLSVGVLVLNYNTWGLALRALDAAIRFESDNVAEYVLFDDGSPSPPPQEIDSRITLIRGESNRGFGHALRVAFAGMKSDIVVLFDSDAHPLTAFSEKVREYFERDPRLGQLGFRAQDENGSQTESFFNEPTQWSLILGQALYFRVSRNVPRPDRLCVITGCMATRAEAYGQVGGFDAGFEFLDVDVDYSIKLRRCGWKVEVDPSIKVFHIGGGTPQLMRHRVLHFYKSRWRLLRNHGLMTSPRLARAFILTRLTCEKAILQLFGRFLYSSSEVLDDKILGRKALLAYCRTNFR